MKILKLAIALILTFNIASAIDTKTVLEIPYNFTNGEQIEETDAKFLVYSNKFENAPSLAEGIETIFKSAGDAEKLAGYLSEPNDVGLAQYFLKKAGDFDPKKFSYVIYDGENMLALLGDRFMQINKDGKWVVSKNSALYSYFAKHSKSAKPAAKDIKKSKEIELLCEDGAFLDTILDEQTLEVHEVFFYYMELSDAFFAHDFQKFTDFLDDRSQEIFDMKTGNASSVDEMVKALKYELKEERVYRNIAKLSDIYVVIFESHNEGNDILTFGTMRDISCGIEIINYDNPDPVLAEFIARKK